MTVKLFDYLSESNYKPHISLYQYKGEVYVESKWLTYLLCFIPKWISGKDYHLDSLFQTPAHKICQTRAEFLKTLFGKVIDNSTLSEASPQLEQIRKLAFKFLQKREISVARIIEITSDLVTTSQDKSVSEPFPKEIYKLFNHYLDFKTSTQLGLINRKICSIHVEEINKSSKIHKNLQILHNVLESHKTFMHQNDMVLICRFDLNGNIVNSPWRVTHDQKLVLSTRTTRVIRGIPENAEVIKQDLQDNKENLDMQLTKIKDNKLKEMVRETIKSLQEEVKQKNSDFPAEPMLVIDSETQVTECHILCTNNWHKAFRQARK